MASHTGIAERVNAGEELPADFSARLEASLQAADQERRRRLLRRRVQAVLPLALLVGPIVAWHLMRISPGGPHAGIAALALVTFVLDVGVHMDTVLLSYLGLQLLPSLVGILLLVVITAGLLLPGEPES